MRALSAQRQKKAARRMIAMFSRSKAKLGVYALPGGTIIRLFFFRCPRQPEFSPDGKLPTHTSKNMRKKTESTNKPSVPARRSAQPAAKQPSAARPARAANPKPKRPARPRAATAAAIRTEDVALRAYFISEKRRQQGLPGDEHQDWIEAERQLRDEISAPRNGGKKRASAN